MGNGNGGFAVVVAVVLVVVLLGVVGGGVALFSPNIELKMLELQKDVLEQEERVLDKELQKTYEESMEPIRQAQADSINQGTFASKMDTLEAHLPTIALVVISVFLALVLLLVVVLALMLVYPVLKKKLHQAVEVPEPLEG